jgi:hypothetical protein
MILRSFWKCSGPKVEPLRRSEGELFCSEDILEASVETMLTLAVKHAENSL